MKRAAEENNLNLRDGQGIMQVLSLRGSNLIEVQSHHFFLSFSTSFTRRLLSLCVCVCRMSVGPRNVLAFRF
jgi:hypothetical protein